jgi:hypothetical protein
LVDTKKVSKKSIAILAKGRKEKSIDQPTRMPIVRCPCGLEILVVPDLKAMDLAINKHKAEHKQSREG